MAGNSHAALTLNRQTVPTRGGGGDPALSIPSCDMKPREHSFPDQNYAKKQKNQRNDQK